MKTLGQAVKADIRAVWKLIRKPTSPAHYALGVFTAWIAVSVGLVACIIVLVWFWAWERWNDRELLMTQEMAIRFGLPLPGGKVYLPQGAMDTWEMAVALWIAFIPVTILNYLGIIMLRL